MDQVFADLLLVQLVQGCRVGIMRSDMARGDDDKPERAPPNQRGDGRRTSNHSFKTKHELLERLLFQVDGGAVLDTFALQARDYDEDDSNVIIIARFCRSAPISNLLPQKRQRCLTASRASSVRPSVPKLFWRSS